MRQGSEHSTVLLVGPKVTLREFNQGDFEAVHAYAREPASWTYVEWHANSPEETREYLAEAARSRLAEPRTTYTLAISTTGADEVVGAIELRVDHPKQVRGSLGYIVNRLHQGHGYATAAAVLLVEFGLGTLGLGRIEATCDPRNVPSTRVLAKSGFRYETRLADHRDLRGELGDSLLFSIEPSHDAALERPRT
jgi:RimJ/RimL family protein N-acetyltransferase